MNGYTNRRRPGLRPARRWPPKKRLRFRLATAAALGVLTVGAGSFCAGMHVGGADEAVRVEEPDECAVEMSLACDGWVDDNVDLGIFLSGFAVDGSKVEEHLPFEKPGTLVVDLDAGYYELVAQVPQIMTEDGVVRAAADCVLVDTHDVRTASAPAVLYEPVETSELSDEELRTIAEASFNDPSIAEAALERALGAHAAPSVQQEKSPHTGELSRR